MGDNGGRGGEYNGGTMAEQHGNSGGGELGAVKNNQVQVQKSLNFCKS